MTSKARKSNIGVIQQAAQDDIDEPLYEHCTPAAISTELYDKNETNGTPVIHRQLSMQDVYSSEERVTLN